MRRQSSFWQRGRRGLIWLWPLLAAAGLVWQVQAYSRQPQADCGTGNVPGTIQTEDVALGGDLYVTGDVLVRNGVTLTLEAGSNVTMCGEYHFRIEGDANLVASGTMTEPITFDAENPAVKWDAIQFIDPGDASVLRYVTLNNGGNLNSHPENAPIFISTAFANAVASPAIDQVTITNSDNYGLSIRFPSTDRTPPAISNVSVSGSAAAAALVDLEALGGLGRGNSFTGNMTDTIQIRGSGSRVYFTQLWRNQGVPFELLGSATIAAESSADTMPVVTMEEGTLFRLAPDVNLNVGTSLGRRGALVANGTATEPITFTRLSDTSGPFGALRLELYPESYVNFSHVNVSDGGQGEVGMIDQYGNGSVNFDFVNVTDSQSDGLYVRDGAVTINNSTFTGHQRGIYFLGANGSGVIRNSSFENNAVAGVENFWTNTLCIDAIGNSWGAADGPADSSAAADGCGNGNSNSGSGQVVSDGVLYEPWLSAVGQLQDRGTINPAEYYVVANGEDEVDVVITLRDAQGDPLVGKDVTLSSTIGSVRQPAAATNASGQTTAVISSTVTGFAYLTAYNDTDDAPVSGIGGVMFWQGNSDAGGLIGASGAPYASPEFIVTGKPFQIGLPVGMQVPMRNANTVPVDVQVVYGVTELNIGGRFVPVYTATETLNPGESWDAQGVWVSSATGHRCLEAALTVDDGQGGRSVEGVFNTRLQQNTDQNPCDPDRLNPQQIIPKRPKGGLLGVAKTLYKVYNLAVKANECIDQSVNFRHSFAASTGRDYETIVTPPVFTAPEITTADGVTQAQADALNDVAQAGMDMVSLNLAMGVTAQRMNWAAQAAGVANIGGSARNVSFVYVDQQFAAYRNFANQYAAKIDAYNAALDDLLAATPDASTTVFLPENFAATQSELEGSGFDADERTFYKDAGFTDELIDDLEADLVRQYTDGAPESITLESAILQAQAELAEIAVRLRAENPLPTTRSAGAQEVIVQPVVYNFEVGHQLSGNRTVNLQVRPVNLPVNWTYELSSANVAVDEGETQTVTLTLYPGSEQLEDDVVQVTVEGYVDGDLVGGILLQHTTPRYMPRSDNSIYLPLLVRN